MSSRQRLLAILTEAGLVDKQLATERAKADRANAGWRGLAALAPLVVDSAQSITGSMDASAKQAAEVEAQRALAAGASDVGTRQEGPANIGQGPSYVDTAAEAAARRAAGIEAPQKTGDPLADFASDPFGFKARALESAHAGAQGKLAGVVQANRDKARAEELQRQQTGQQREDAAAKVSAKAAEVAAKAQEVADGRAMKEAAAAEKTARTVLPSFVRGALASGMTPAAIVQSAHGNDALGPISDDAEVWAAIHDAQAAEKLQAAKLASMAADAAKKGRPPVARPRPLRYPEASEADRIAQLDTTLGTVDSIAGLVKANPTGITAALQNIAGRIPGVGTTFDPGAKNQTVYNTMQAFKTSELKRLSGTGVTAGERAAFDRFNPNIEDAPEVALSKLGAYRVAIVRARQEQVKTLRELRGVEVPASYDTAPADPNAAPPPPTSEVTLVTNGQETRRIPRRRLPEAIADGWHEVAP